MRLRFVAAYTLAASLVIAAGSHCSAATKTFVGGSFSCGFFCDDWNIASNWSPSGVPTLADDVIIPSFGCVTVCSADAYANTVTVQTGAQIEILNAALEVDGGGNNPSSVNAQSGIILDHSQAKLRLTANQTWSGSGSITLSDTTAAIQLSSGVTWTVAFASVQGFGEIDSVSGTATLKLDNGADLIADVSTATLELSSSLLLDDTSSNNLWKADGGKLRFLHAATNLVGLLTVVSGGTLRFNADVTTAGTFIFNGGFVEVAHDTVFTYTSFAGSCVNPGSGSSPYTISGPVGSGETLVECE
jgi:hypothetical protein